MGRFRESRRMAVGFAAVLVVAASLVVMPGVAFAAPGTTTTTVTGTPVPVTGQPIIFTATVTHGTSTQTPTGWVTFTITGADLSTPTCYGGSNMISLTPNTSGPGSVAQCSIPDGLFASASPYSVAAAYSGDGTFSPSLGSLSKTIHLGPTITTLSSATNPSVTGQPVSFSATVGPASPATGTPTRSVTFTIIGANGSTMMCDGGNNNIALIGNMATCSVSGGLLAADSVYTVKGTYSGDSNFATSSGTVLQTVSRDTATITLASSAPTLVMGQPVTFTASVAVNSPGAGTPSGNVVFALVGVDGSTPTCDGGDTAPIDTTTETAQCTFAGGLGANGLIYTVSATLMDPNFKTLTPGTLTQPVTKALTQTVLTGLPGSVYAGSAFSFGATVTTVAPGTGAPTKFIEWSICPYESTTCTGYPGGTVALPTPRAGEIANNDNKIKFSVPGGLKPGFYAVSATYQGASAYENSTAVGYILVRQVPTIIEVFSSKNPAMNGDSVALRAGVLPNPPGTVKITPQLGAPSGTLTFAVTDMNGDMLTCDGGSNVITISNNANNQGFGRCVIDAGQLMSADSPYTVTVSYSGDSKYLSSNGELKVHITS